MEYEERLKDLRYEKDLKQNDVAKILNISRALYSQYETYEKIIPLAHLNSLANYFNVSVDYLLGLTDIKCYERYNKIDINKEVVGLNLKKFRKDKNITLVKLAEILNTSHSTLSAYESGKTLILTSFLYTICKKYKISADYLLDKIEEPIFLN